MALEKCHECGREISTVAKSCPQCGAKNKKRKVSGAIKLLAVLLVIVGYLMFEHELNPTIPSCESPRARKIFTDLVESSPWAQLEKIRALDVIDQKEVSAGSRPEDRVCEATFRLSNSTKKTYIFTFEDKPNGGYYVRAKAK